MVVEQHEPALLGRCRRQPEAVHPPVGTTARKVDALSREVRRVVEDRPFGQRRGSAQGVGTPIRVAAGSCFNNGIRHCRLCRRPRGCCGSDRSQACSRWSREGRLSACRAAAIPSRAATALAASAYVKLSPTTTALPPGMLPPVRFAIGQQRLRSRSGSDRFPRCGDTEYPRAASDRFVTWFETSFVSRRRRSTSRTPSAQLGQGGGWESLSRDDTSTGPRTTCASGAAENASIHDPLPTSTAVVAVANALRLSAAA